MSADRGAGLAAGASASGGGAPAGSGRSAAPAGRGFTPAQTAYLNALPAVATCDGRRIVYTDGFRERCMKRYAAGELPTDLFREAGLDPELVGAKRIGRAFARWRRAAGVPALPAGRPSRAQSDSTHGERVHGERTRESSPVVDDVVQSGGSDDVAADGGGLTSLLLAQQAHYIAALERRVAELERELAEARHAMPDGRRPR